MNLEVSPIIYLRVQSIIMIFWMEKITEKRTKPLTCINFMEQLHLGFLEPSPQVSSLRTGLKLLYFLFFMQNSSLSSQDKYGVSVVLVVDAKSWGAKILLAINSKKRSGGVSIGTGEVVSDIIENLSELLY